MTNQDITNILIIDDSIDQLHYISKLLLKYFDNNVKIYECINKEGVINTIKNLSKIDYLITDLVLPDIDGIKLTQSLINEYNIDIGKIIIQTGFGFDDKLLPEDFSLLNKPFTYDDLLSVLKYSKNS